MREALVVGDPVVHHERGVGKVTMILPVIPKAVMVRFKGQSKPVPCMVTDLKPLNFPMIVARYQGHHTVAGTQATYDEAPF